MAHVAADIDGEVTADRTGLRVSRIGGSEECAAALHHVLALPHHANDWARANVLDQTVKERLGGEVLVVRLSLLSGGLQHLESHELEALALKAGNDLTNETTLDAVGLHSNESALRGHFP